MHAPQSQRSLFEVLGLRAEQILLPLDLERVSPEAFDLANAFARPAGTELTLLYVGRPSERKNTIGLEVEVTLTAKRVLQQLCREFLRPGIEPDFVVRWGEPSTEIIAEAARSSADLLLLPTDAGTFWDRMLGKPHSTVAREVSACARCRTVIVEVKGQVNRLRGWRSPSARTLAAA